jgi:L-serine deaminase
LTVLFDATVNAMLEIGKNMRSKLKETVMGGLAICMVLEDWT